MVALPTEVTVHLRGALVHQQVLPPGEYVIGQNAAADICIAQAELAPRHARLRLTSAEWIVEDLGAAAGTFVNDERVADSRVVLPTQTISAGAATISLRRLQGSDDGETLGPQASAVRPLLPAELRVGERYEIGPLVGRGGMGVIVDAHDLTVQRNVAMKLMRDCTAPAAVARFVQEAQVTAQLEHPNIVPVHELSVNEQNQPYYTMKFVRGISLGSVLELLSHGDPTMLEKYPLSALLTVFQKICDAIAFAHSKGVIHRDLKPDNIMLGTYGEALVMDWGLAKVLGRDGGHDPSQNLAETRSLEAGATAPGPTLTGTVMGTPQYMSPEQAAGEIENLDAATDIYALGAMLYHLLALRPPFTGRTTAEVLSAVRAGAIEPPHAARGTRALLHLPGGKIPESLMAVARKAMSLEPRLRYASVKDLQVDIEAYQTGFATRAEHASAWKLLRLFLRRHRTVSIAAALLLLSGAIFTIYLARARNRANRERDVAEEHLYLSHMLQAGRQLADGRPESARELLRRHRREPSGRDLRGWEWFYLSGQLHQHRLAVHAHQRGVYAVAASADGARLATGGGDGELAVWRARGLVPEFRLPAHQGIVHGVSWQTGGRLLASAGEDGMVRVWDTQSREKVAELHVGAGPPVRSVAWQPKADGTGGLAIGGAEKQVLLWYPLADPPAPPQPLFKTENGTASVHWSADGNRLAAGGMDADKTIHVYDIKEEKLRLSTRATSGNHILAAAMSPDGKHVAAGSKHLAVSVLEVGGKRVFNQPLHRGFVSALAWSADSRHLASTSHDGTIRLTSPLSSGATQILSGHEGAVNSLAWTRLPAAESAPAGTSALFSGGADGTLRAWAPSLKGEIALTVKDSNWVAGACWSPDGRRIAMTNFYGHVHLLDPSTGASFPLCSTPGGVFDVAWSPTGDRLATTSRDRGRVEVLDAADGRSLGQFALERVRRVAWSPSGEYLAGAGSRGLHVWELKTGRAVAAIDRSAGSAVWHRDGRQIVLGAQDGAIELWDAFAAKKLADWRAPTAPAAGSITSEHEPPRQVFDLRWSPDGQHLAFATQDNVAALLDARDGRQVRAFSGHSSGVWRVAWSPDGQRLATCGQDGTARVFKAQTGDLVAQIDHAFTSTELNAVDWSPSGRQFLTGGHDQVVRIWDAERGYGLDAVETEGRPTDRRTLATEHVQLGRVDDARRAPATAAAAEAWYAQALDGTAFQTGQRDPASAARARAMDLLLEIHDTWEAGRTEGAFRAFHDLAQNPVASEALPYARSYFSQARWKVAWFPSSADPRQDLAGWRALANGPEAVSAVVRSLNFPYRQRGPHAVLAGAEPSERVITPERFGTIARTTLKLPAGKWQFRTRGSGGVRITLDEKNVIENWQPNALFEEAGEYDQPQTGDVVILVEHFVVEPIAEFRVELEPAVPRLAE